MDVGLLQDGDGTMTKNLTATYKGGTYICHRWLGQIEVRHPKFKHPVRFPIPPARFMAEMWNDTAEELREFWSQVCGYDFETDARGWIKQ